MLKTSKPVVTSYTRLGPLDFTQVKKASLILRAINHTLRYKILHLIEETRKATVTELYVKLGLEQSVASQHLAILRRSSIVKTSREGKFIYYELNYSKLDQLDNCVKELLQLKGLEEPGDEMVEIEMRECISESRPN